MRPLTSILLTLGLVVLARLAGYASAVYDAVLRSGAKDLPKEHRFWSVHAAAKEKAGLAHTASLRKNEDYDLAAHRGQHAFLTHLTDASVPPEPAKLLRRIEWLENVFMVHESSKDMNLAETYADWMKQLDAQRRRPEHAKTWAKANAAGIKYTAVREGKGLSHARLLHRQSMLNFEVRDMTRPQMEREVCQALLVATTKALALVDLKVDADTADTVEACIVTKMGNPFYTKEQLTDVASNLYEAITNSPATEEEKKRAYKIVHECCG